MEYARRKPNPCELGARRGACDAERHSDLDIENIVERCMWPMANSKASANERRLLTKSHVGDG